jgi:hypothetical protein
MATLSESVRRVTTFLLAVFLWTHALFFLNVQSTILTKCAHLLRLTTSEVLLFALLVLFSFASGSGFWKPFRSLIYIYCFPFVLFGYALYWGFLILRALNRWFNSQANPQLGDTLVVEQREILVSPSPNSESKVDFKKEAGEVFGFLLRPFRRFMFLWCILLLVTSHVQVVWVCLAVVVLHLSRKIVGILKVMLFSGPWLRKIGASLLRTVEAALTGIGVVTADTAPTNELRNTWNQLNLWKKVTDFLRDPYLVSRWAWFLALVCLGSLYVYIAVLFSFAYYGIARVSNIAYSWGDALVASLFIPFFVTELPKTIVFRVLGGLHCFLVLTIGVGTLINFIHGRLVAIQAAALVINDRLTDQNIQEKFLILEAKFKASPSGAPSTPNTKAEQEKG